MKSLRLMQVAKNFAIMKNEKFAGLFGTKRGKCAVSKTWEIASLSDHEEKSVSIMNFGTGRQTRH